MDRWSMPTTRTMAFSPALTGERIAGRSAPSPQPCRVIRPLVVAVDAFAALVPLLGFQAEGGDGPGVESSEANWLASLFAVAVGAVLDPPQRLVDLGDQ